VVHPSSGYTLKMEGENFSRTS